MSISLHINKMTLLQSDNDTKNTNIISNAIQSDFTKYEHMSARLSFHISEFSKKKKQIPKQ